MRAFHLIKPGDIDSIVLRDHAIPDRGAREVLVRIRASAFNRRDMMILNGTYARIPFRPDCVPLSDAAGIVVATGPGVTRFKVDDAVISTPVPRWLGGRISPAALTEQPGASHDGMLCEYRVFCEDALVSMPPHLGFEEAAALPAAGVTAWTALKGVFPGETVLVAGSSSVSLFAIQFAKVMGAEVIATTSDDAKAERLEALGAKAVVNYTRADWPVAVRDLTSGRGADRVIDMGGIATLGQSIKSAALGAQVSVVGTLAGAGTLDSSAFSSSVVNIHRIAVGSRADMEEMNRATSAHRLKPVIDRVFDFTDAKEAYRYFDAGRYFGKVIIRHGD